MPAALADAAGGPVPLAIEVAIINGHLSVTDIPFAWGPPAMNEANQAANTPNPAGPPGDSPFAKRGGCPGPAATGGPRVWPPAAATQATPADLDRLDGLSAVRADADQPVVGAAGLL